MVASRTFDSILNQIQISNLNFHLQVSPFSANISLKRSPVKDKSGSPICYPPTTPSSLPNASDEALIESLNSKIIKLERALDSSKLKMKVHSVTLRL